MRKLDAQNVRAGAGFIQGVQDSDNRRCWIAPGGAVTYSKIKASEWALWVDARLRAVV